MPANDDHSRLQNLGTVMGAPEGGLRYMRRRRVGTADRDGNPLDGIVNLFDVAIVLAVGFLVAALAAAGVSGLLASENMTIVTSPGTSEMQVIVKEGDQITRLDVQSGAEVFPGAGALIGSFYGSPTALSYTSRRGWRRRAALRRYPGTTPAPAVTATPGVTALHRASDTRHDGDPDADAGGDADPGRVVTRVSRASAGARRAGATRPRP